MERFDEFESPEDTPITSALAAIPTNFASKADVVASLTYPLFREPPAEMTPGSVDLLNSVVAPIIFDKIDLFYFKTTRLSIVGYGESLEEPNKFCVVKFINPGCLIGDGFYAEVTTRRFRREIEFLLCHQENPLWVRAQKTGEGRHPFPPYFRPYPYLVMEFCPGVDGDDFCNAPAFREASANPAFLAAFALASLRIFADVAKEGRVLRDFKTGNVMITPRGFVFIDPGSISETDSDLTPPGFINGTPAFMSPEQACGEPLDFRSDLYALGVCLFYFATKKYPFEGATAWDVMIKHLKEPVPVGALNHLPLQLRTIIYMLLAKDRQDRFQSLEEAAEFFRPFVQGTEMEAFLPPTLVRPPSFMPTVIDE